RVCNSSENTAEIALRKQRERGKQHNESCAEHTRSDSASQCNGCHSASISNTPLTIGGGSNAYPSGCRKSASGLLRCGWFVSVVPLFLLRGLIKRRRVPVYPV